MNDYGTDESVLCLTGTDARQFMRQPVGAKITLTLDCVITKSSVEPLSDGSGDKQPVVELSINNISVAKKQYAAMSTAEMDQEIQDIKEGRPESIWTQQKKQDKVNQTPDNTKLPPFAYR